LFVSLAAGVVFIFAFPNWGELASFGTAATVFTYLAGPTCVVILRKHTPELKRPFRVPRVGLIAPVSFVMSSLVVYWTTWPYTGYSLAAFMLGLAVFMLSRPKGTYRLGEVRRGLWIVVYSVALTTVSYLGSYGIDTISFPLDFGLVGVLALAGFYWGARSGFLTRELSGLIEQEKVEDSLAVPPDRRTG
jgi:amino acid transporter